jgi:hypothetical protein
MAVWPSFDILQLHQPALERYFTQVLWKGARVCMVMLKLF